MEFVYPRLSLAVKSCCMKLNQLIRKVMHIVMDLFYALKVNFSSIIGQSSAIQPIAEPTQVLIMCRHQYANSI